MWLLLVSVLYNHFNYLVDQIGLTQLSYAPASDVMFIKLDNMIFFGLRIQALMFP